MVHRRSIKPDGPGNERPGTTLERRWNRRREGRLLAGGCFDVINQIKTKETKKKGFTGFYLVLKAFLKDWIGLHYVLPSFTGLYWVLPSFTGCYKDWIGLYYVLPSFTGFYWVLLDFT